MTVDEAENHDEARYEVYYMRHGSKHEVGTTDHLAAAIVRAALMDESLALGERGLTYILDRSNGARCRVGADMGGRLKWQAPEEE